MAGDLNRFEGHRPLRVKSLYASDFGKVSPGGIRSVIEVLARGSPSEVALTHVGVGPLDGSLPAQDNEYLGLGQAVVPGEGVGINLEFVRRMFKNRSSIFSDTDIVIVHRPEHALAIPLGLPFVLLLHGGSWGAWRAKKSVFSFLYPLLEIYAAFRAKVVLTVASGSHTRALEAFSRPVSITTAYNEMVFRPTDHNRTGDSPPRLVSVARLVAEKRLHLVLEAASSVGASTVDIFGEGPERGVLAKRARELGLKLNLHGHVAPEELAKWYNEHASVFVLTSIFEGFPVSALEAAGTGTPVVALSAPGTKQAIPMMGGHLAHDVSMLPAVIRKAWSDGNLYAPQDLAHRFGTAAVCGHFWAKVKEVVSTTAR